MDENPSVAYANADFIPQAAEIFARWPVEAAAYRHHLGARALTDIRYGPEPRESFDLFLPEVPTPAGLMVFIHGGYWMESEPASWSHLARGAIDRDWAVAMPGYTLAPDARLGQITRQVEAAITEAAGIIGGPITVTGHSAGGHLAARMACADRTPEWAERLTRVVPISPLADLAPLMHTEMNAILRIDAAEVQAESPARLPRKPGLDCTVWVGGQERPSFLWQARLLSERWDCPWHVDVGRHHFDVIDALGDCESLLVKTLLD